jgi:tRNA-splicing ligase RtcB
MSESTYNVLASEGGVPVKAWTKGVPLEDAARQQLLNAAQLPFVFKWIAAMPDVHWGIGATVGSVIPTRGAIIPAAVGVDIGCGMMAVQTSLNARYLPDSLKPLRAAIERAVPATTSLRSASMSPRPCGSCCAADRAVWAIAWAPTSSTWRATT